MPPSACNEETREASSSASQHWIARPALARSRWSGSRPQPTVNIEGLVAGYTGPGGKTVLPAPRASPSSICAWCPT